MIEAIGELFEIFFDDVFDRIREIKNIKRIKSKRMLVQEAIYYIGIIVALLVLVTSIIVGIASYVLFIVDGGYSSQIELIKASGLGGLAKCFTAGTVKTMMTGKAGLLLRILSMSEITIILVYFFMRSNCKTNIIMAIDLVSWVACIIIALIILGRSNFSNQSLILLEDTLYDLGDAQKRVFLIVYLIICLVTIIIWGVLFFRVFECSELFVVAAFVALCSYVLLPLLFLILENIIPILGWGLVIILGIVAFFIIALMSGSGSSGSGSSGSSSKEETVEDAKLKSLMSDAEIRFVRAQFPKITKEMSLEKFFEIEDSIKVRGTTEWYREFGFFLIYNRTKSIYLICDPWEYNVSFILHKAIVRGENYKNPYPHKHYEEGDSFTVRFIPFEGNNEAEWERKRKEIVDWEKLIGKSYQSYWDDKR